MREADLNAMVEVRIRMPREQAYSWFARVCDGEVKLTDMGLEEDAEISIVPVEEKESLETSVESETEIPS
jgi:hypothetical protein